MYSLYVLLQTVNFIGEHIGSLKFTQNFSPSLPPPLPLPPSLSKDGRRSSCWMPGWRTQQKPVRRLVSSYPATWAHTTWTHPPPPLHHSPASHKRERVRGRRESVGCVCWVSLPMSPYLAAIVSVATVGDSTCTR